MRAACAAVSSLGLSAATLTLLLLVPAAAFFLVPALALALGVLAVVRIDWAPWIVAPMLGALTLWAFSAPGGYVFEAAGAVLGWCLFGVVLVVRVARRRRIPLSRSAARLWAASVVCGLLVAAASSAWIPLDARFALSEDVMNETARAVIQGDLDPATVDRIGWWNVGRVERGPGGMRFTVEGAGLLSYSGFAYQADGLSPSVDGDSFRYWRRGWYIWTGGSS